MPRSKRRSLSTTAGPRRSARHHTAPTRFGHGETTTRPPPTTNGEGITIRRARLGKQKQIDTPTSVSDIIHDVNKTLADHNNLLLFAPDALPVELERDSHALGEPIANAQTAVNEALNRLRAAYDHTVSLSNRLSHAIGSDPLWYTRGNLFALRKTELEKMLLRYPPQDAASFASAICSSLPGVSASVRATALLSNDHLEPFLQLRLMGKVLVRLQNAFQIFRVSVAVRAHLFRPQHDHHVRRDHVYGRLVLLTENNIDFCFRQERDPLRRSWLPKHQPKYPEYLNCAAARRELWSVWQTVECDLDSSFNFEDGEHVWYHCFHRMNHDLLGKVQQRAYDEIRNSVAVAVAERLPVELADAIFEYALAAEEVPMDCNVGPQHEPVAVYRCRSYVSS